MPNEGKEKFAQAQSNLKNKNADTQKRLYEFMCRPKANQPRPVQQKFMPDDHSDLEPLLPIPNRTVKHLSANDSADSRVKVGHRQALIAKQTPSPKRLGVLFLCSCSR